MAKKEYYFKGKSKWSYLLKPDMKYNAWSQQLILDPASYDLFMKLKESTPEMDGILNEVQQTEDGYVVNFKRPISRDYKGQTRMFTPPIVLDKDNLPWKGDAIGHGSDLTVKVEWYSFNPPFKKKKGCAIRMESVRVDNLVPWEMKRDFDPAEMKAVTGLVDQPGQPF